MRKALGWLAKEEGLVERIKGGTAQRERSTDLKLADLVGRYTKWQKLHNKKRSVESYEYCIAQVLSYLHGIYVRTIGKLQPEHVEGYKTSQKGKVSARTINLRIAHFKAALNYAVQQNKIDHNPLQHVKRLKDDGFRKLKNKKNRRNLTDPEMAALLEASPPTRKLIWWTFMASGLRNDELCQLRRDDLDATGCRLRVRGEGAKHREAGEDAWQPIPKDLSAALATYVMEHGQEPLFPSQRDAHRSRWCLLDLFYRDCDKAGIDRGDSEVDIQCLRSTYLTMMADPARGLDLKTLAELGRHRDIRTTMKHYVKARQDKARDAVDGLDIGRASGS